MRNLLQRTILDKLHVVLIRGMCLKVPILSIVDEKQTINSAGAEETLDWITELNEFQELDCKSVLEPPKSEDSYDATPSLKPTFNLAAYANNSKTLQKLIKIGVDLNKIERRKGLAQFILKLNFENDMENHIRFLHHVCDIPRLSFGKFLTKNPLIFKEDLLDLETRVNYLKSKLFQPTDITRIVEVNPFWLMFSTQRIDNRLGYFQKKFQLTGVQVRQLTVKQPRLITYHLDSVEQNAFSVQEEFGFTLDETKALILQTPKVLMLSKKLKYFQEKSFSIFPFYRSKHLNSSSGLCP